MKKNILIKGILVLIAITLLTMGFAGCVPVVPLTGTLYITIGGWYPFYTYDIYLGAFYYGLTSSASFTITNITPGWYTLGAYEYWTGWPWDTITVYINAGANYVTISPF